jgi:excisionase family DNA binding protein
LNAEKTYITVRELSERISTPAYTIRRLVREGRLPAYQLTGRGYLLNLEEVEEVIRQCRLKK